ncbi:hypothetical protein COCON_G00020570 [Conger conger]|uniref:Uncharacterized protein n=1 Tax=Conger conger TaxID=82655 RepID=A0A9Q1DWS2_CONCO|nr:hypothetical protein COCON_G00020570 [Conger conger]
MTSSTSRPCVTPERPVAAAASRARHNALALSRGWPSSRQTASATPTPLLRAGLIALRLYKPERSFQPLSEQRPSPRRGSLRKQNSEIANYSASDAKPDVETATPRSRRSAPSSQIGLPGNGRSRTLRETHVR